MIIYNVTISIRQDLEGEVLAWLKNEHIPEILETGLFVEHHIFKIFESSDQPMHNSFAIQYHLESWQHFKEYEANHAPALKEKTLAKYGENLLAFRTFLEKL